MARTLGVGREVWVVWVCVAWELDAVYLGV